MDEARIKAALAPDMTQRADYIGRIQQSETITVITEDGTPIETQVKFYLSWDSIQSVLDIARRKILT